MEPWRYRIYWTSTPPEVFTPLFLRQPRLVSPKPSGWQQMRISEGIGRSINEAVDNSGGANGWTLLYWSLLGPVEKVEA